MILWLSLRNSTPSILKQANHNAGSNLLLYLHCTRRNSGESLDTQHNTASRRRNSKTSEICWDLSEGTTLSWICSFGFVPFFEDTSMATSFVFSFLKHGVISVLLVRLRVFENYARRTVSFRPLNSASRLQENLRLFEYVRQNSSAVKCFHLINFNYCHFNGRRDKQTWANTNIAS